MVPMPRSSNVGSAARVRGVLIAFLAGAWLAAAPAAAAPPWTSRPDAKDPHFGKAQEAYDGDWAQLPLGNVAGKWNGDLKDLKDADGEKLHQTWVTSDEVTIKDIRARVHWSEPGRKKNTLFNVVGARRVIIDNVAIVAADPDARMYDTIRIENADEVIVRNSYFAGAVQSYHLRIFGARRVLVDGVEIAGVKVDGGGFRAGGGIWIKNARNENKRAEQKLEGPVQWTPSEWVQVQNCWIHDFDDADQPRNQDAINIESPGDGLVFNNVIDNWAREKTVGDGGLDLSYRQREAAGDKRFRVERNVFRNVTFTKSPAWGQDTNVVVWANNLYLDTPFTDGHGGWLNVIAHNTYVYSSYDRPPFRMWAKRENGRTVFESNAVYSSTPMKMMFSEAKEGEPDKLKLWRSDRNAYAMPQPELWLGGESPDKARSIKDWNSLGFDGASQVTAPAGACSKELPAPGKGIGCALPALRDAEKGSIAQAQAITRDFWGRPRGATPRVGAFEE